MELILVRLIAVIIVLLAAHRIPVYTISLNSKLQMKYWRIKVCILMPASIQQGILKAEVLFANKDLGLLVKAKATAIHGPVWGVFDLLFLVFGLNDFCVSAY